MTLRWPSGRNCRGGRLLLQRNKHTASRSGTGITGLLRLFILSLTEIISSGVNNDSTLGLLVFIRSYIYSYFERKGRTYSNNTQRTNQLNVLIFNGTNTISLGISLEVSEITYMANLICRSTVGLTVWVD